MNKKLLALAVGSVFAAPVFAQSNVTLYGRLNVGIDNYSATGATAGAAADLKSRNRIYDSGSRLGVRGTEDLGGGLRAVFQIESGLNADNGGQTGQGGQTNGSSGFLASRPSFGGLEGGFGRLTFGRQDVWWGNGTIQQTGANFLSTELPWTTGSQGRVNAGIARQSNVMQYTTPTFGGFNLTASYSPDTTPGGGFVNSESQQGGAETNARLLGLTARWAGGPISFQVDYSEKKSVTTAGNTPKNQNLKVGLGFRYAPGSQISLLGSQLKNNDVAAIAGLQGAGDDLKQGHITLGWEHTFGNLQAFAQLGVVRNATGCSVAGGCDDSGARGGLVGVRYNMSKRTALIFNATKVANKQRSNADYVGGSFTSANPLPIGADPRIIGFGVWHQF